MRWLIALLVIGSIQTFAQKVMAEKLVTKAEISLANGQFEETLQTLNTCIEKFPTEPTAYQLRAQVKEKLDDFPGALTDLNIAVELMPESPEILLNRAILAYKLKRFDLAKPDFQRLITFQGTETNMIFFRQSNNEGVDNVMTAQSNIQDQVYNYLGLIEYSLENFPSSVLYFDSAIAINKLKVVLALAACLLSYLSLFFL